MQLKSTLPMGKRLMTFLAMGWMLLLKVNIFKNKGEFGWLFYFLGFQMSGNL